MTKTNKKSKLLALFGLIVAGITALTCAILVTPRNTFASDSGIDAINFPDTSRYTEKDIAEGDTLAGKFFRVTAETEGKIVVGTYDEVTLKIVSGDSAYFCDTANDGSTIGLMAYGNAGENTLDIYVQKDKTITTTMGDVSTNDFVFDLTKISDCTVKELVAPVKPDTSTYVEAEHVYGTQVTGKIFRAKYTSDFMIGFNSATTNGFYIDAHMGLEPYEFYIYYDGGATFSEKELLNVLAVGEGYVDFEVLAGTCSDMSTGTYTLTIDDTTVFNKLSDNVTLYELTAPTNDTEKEEDAQNKVEQWLDNAGDVISDWLNENLGVSIGGSVALVIVVAIIVAILKRKK